MTVSLTKVLPVPTRGVPSIRYTITSLFANDLRAGDVIEFAETMAGEPVPNIHPLAVVIAVGKSADMYLDDAEPTTLITEDEHGNHLIDHVPPMRRFHVVRPEVSHAREPYPGGDFVS